jgi:hypothetical protein
MKKYRLTDGYAFKGYKPYCRVEGNDLQEKDRIIRLKRVLKKRHVLNAAEPTAPFMIAHKNGCETCRVETLWSTCSLNAEGCAVDRPVR